MRKLLSEIVKSYQEGTFFYVKDAEDDFGVYEAGTYESGKPRVIYFVSRSTKEEAKNLCDKLNSGELTREKI